MTNNKSVKHETQVTMTFKNKVYLSKHISLNFYDSDTHKNKYLGDINKENKNKYNKYACMHTSTYM